MTRRLPVNFILGAVLVALVVGTAALSLVWTPHDATLMTISNKFAPPRPPTGWAPTSWAAMCCRN